MTSGLCVLVHVPKVPVPVEARCAGQDLSACCIGGAMPRHRQGERERLQVREVALEAIARARRGDGPTLIEAETYRFRGHSLADPDELRDKKEKEYYNVRAPAGRLEARAPRCGSAV